MLEAGGTVVSGGAADTRPLGSTEQHRTTSNAIPRISARVRTLSSDRHIPTRSIHSDHDRLLTRRERGHPCFHLKPYLSSRRSDLGGNVGPSALTSQPHRRDDPNDDRPAQPLLEYGTTHRPGPRPSRYSAATEAT